VSEPTATSVSLLERIRAQDPHAWQQLVTLYGPLVQHWCQRWGARLEDAEEIVQDVFLAASAGLGKFERRQAGSFRAWMRGITRHKLLDHLRRQQGRPVAAGGTDAMRRLHELPDPEGTVEEQAEETSGLYHRALDLIRSEFEERTWLAFWQSAVEGRETSAVAAALNMSAVAVRIAKSRVLSRLREAAGQLIE
jgi:RNA polymerase sigma-70 factor (ECF subfamily)